MEFNWSTFLVIALGVGAGNIISFIFAGIVAAFDDKK